MIKIRLQRKGRIRRPIYHIVVADSRSPRDGRIIEQVGRFDGVTEKKETVLNEARIAYWLDNGAKPTDAVQKILRNEGFLYKRHLQMWGKSEAEIEADLAEWSANRASKKETETTRKEQVRASLLDEEKEVKKQTQQKASEAAAEMAQEVAAEEEVASEETTAAVAEEAVEEVATETAEETQAEDVVEEATEEAPAEETPVEASEETTEGATNSSKDMTAKDAVNHIAAHSVEELSGFVSDDEDRKTVLAAWEAKKEA